MSPSPSRPFRTLALVAALTAASVAHTAAHAAAPAGWSAVGDVAAPSSQWQLTTAFVAPDDPDAPFNLSGVAAVDVGTIESAAGLPAYALDLVAQPASEGSFVWRSFGVAAGDRLLADWRFTSLDSDFDDHAFVVIDGVATTLATRSAPGADGLQRYEHVFAAAGTVQVGFGVVDTGDFVGVSTLTLQGVQVSPVPEPGSAGLLAAGLLAGAAFRRLRRPSGSA